LTAKTESIPTVVKPEAVQIIRYPGKKFIVGYADTDYFLDNAVLVAFPYLPNNQLRLVERKPVPMFFTEFT
jgi:hypothetical protein